MSGAPDPTTPAGPSPDPTTFLSGESGRVGGIRLGVTRRLADGGMRLASALTLTGRRLDRLAAGQAPRKVLVLSIYRPGSRLPGAIAQLSSDRHEVRLVLGSTGDADPALAEHTAITQMAGGKFENLNRLLAAAPALDEFDWLLVIDDDVDLARHFLDRHIALCERLGLDLSQPAQSARSHTAWRVTRRKPFSLARITAYVEIGPVTAFRAPAARALTPFPELRYGWGLDNHWGAIARERGWRLGVVDSLPVRHETQHVAATYTHAAAKAEASEFLTDRPYVTTREAQRALRVIRRVPKVDASRGLNVLVVPKWYPWPDDPVLGLFCREHARALAGRHEVVVLASRAVRSPDFGAFDIDDGTEDGLRTLRVRYRRPRIRALGMVLQIAGMLAALRRLRRDGFRPDVVHAHVYSAGLPALVLGRLSRARVVVTEHYTGFQRGLIRGSDLLTARIAFTGADLVAPVSAELAGHLRRIAPRARLRVLPNVVDTDVFTPAQRASHPAPARLLSVGSLAEKKGHTYLLDALAQLRGRHELSLDIVGAGELRASLEAQTERLDLADRVRFRGELAKAQVAALMREADLLVLPSLYENLPCVLIEAMATGLASVATDVGGVSELIDSEAGVLVSSGDHRALAEGIAAALGRDFDSAEIARSAARRFSYDAVAREWTAVYEELSSSRGSTSLATRLRRASSR